MKTKAQISCSVTVQLIRAFVFATKIVQSLYFLNQDFKPLAKLCGLFGYAVCVRSGQKSADRFCGDAAHIYYQFRCTMILFDFQIAMKTTSVPYRNYGPNMPSSKYCV